MKIRILSGAWIVALMLSGCATTYKDYKSSNLKPGEGVAVGKIHVRYNGKDLNAECAVCLNSVNGPCQRLTPEGYVIQNIATGPASLRRLVCKDVSQQHYNIQDAAFTQTAGVTYFGDVTLDWSNGGGFKVSSMFGLVGALISESHNDGQIRMSVARGDVADVTQVYQNIIHEKGVHTQTDLVRIGR